MSTPIIEYIAENIKTAVNAVTVAAGFNQDLIAVRPKRIDFATGWDDLTVLINQVESEELEAGCFTKQWRQFFLLAAIIIDSDEAIDSIDTRQNQVRADLEKKLTEAPTRGGYAIDTAIRESTPFDDDEGVTGIAMRISVDYRTKDNDPYTKG